MIDQFAQQGGGGNALDFTGTGDLGAEILKNVPEAFRAFVEPYIAGIVTAIHEAFALAIGTTFWVGIAAAIIAAVFVLFVRDPEQPVMIREAEREALARG
jgi:hypothetical protein